MLLTPPQQSGGACKCPGHRPREPRGRRAVGGPRSCLGRALGKAQGGEEGEPRPPGSLGGVAGVEAVWRYLVCCAKREMDAETQRSRRRSQRGAGGGALGLAGPPRGRRREQE